jgi:hypothetical protein
MLPPEIASFLKLAGKKHRQHYVFQHYLKAWATDGKVWARRRGNKKAFHTATSNVAVERHFYKLQPATAEDLTLIRIAILDGAPIHVRERCELLIHNFTVPLTVKRALDPAQPHFEEISAWLDERIINAEEDLHCDVEYGLMPALDDMLNGKTDLYLESGPAQEFIHAICVQYMRTKRMREGLSAAIEGTPVPGSDMKRCRNLFTLIAAMRVADLLYRDRNKYKIVLLDNETDIPLITGDQPVINVHATFGSGVPPDRLELFYPLSPKRAMALLELATEGSTALSMNEVQQFNEMIVRNSHEQVFSNSGEYLEGLQMDGPQEV